MVSTVPNDIFLDIFKCLPANEVEKCQLVSQSWNYLIIASHTKELPLWNFHLLNMFEISLNSTLAQIEIRMHSYKEEEDGPLILVNDDLAKQFKKVIFSEIGIGIDNGGQNREIEPSAESVLAAFKKLLDVCGQKVRGVEFSSGIDMPIHNFMETYTKILCDFVDVQEALIFLEEHEINGLCQENSSMDFGLNPRKIRISPTTVTNTFDRILQFFKSVTFLEPSKFFYEEGYRHVPDNFDAFMNGVVKEFCFEILKEFINAKEPGQMIGNVKIGFEPPSRFTNTDELWREFSKLLYEKFSLMVKATMNYPPAFLKSQKISFGTDTELEFLLERMDNWKIRIFMSKVFQEGIWEDTRFNIKIFYD